MMREALTDRVGLVRAGKSSLKLGAFIVGVNGIAVDGRPELAACAHVGRVLGTVKQSLQLAIGGFINWLEREYGEEASQIIDYETFGDDRTVMVWRWVDEKVPLEVRRLDQLSFTHHQVVAVLEPEHQTEWLERAVINGWSVSQLKAAMTEAGAVPVKTKPPAYWLEVKCEDEEDRQALLQELAAKGRICRARMMSRRDRD
ncbi:MAG: hypothetical protein ACREJC_13010 [Tepidisphaeraceae bacterium]